jgi:hypothetical protein
VAKLINVIGHGDRMPDMEFQESHFNRRRDTNGKVIYSSSSDHCRSTATKYTSVLDLVADAEFQLNALNERRDTANKVLLSSTKFPSF